MVFRSWASMDGNIDIPISPYGVDPCATIASIDYMPVDPSNPYGALKHATITLKGLAVDVIAVEANANADHNAYRPFILVTVQWWPCKALIQMVSDDGDDINKVLGDLLLFCTYVYPDRETGDVHGEALVLKPLRKPITGLVSFVRVGASQRAKLTQEMVKGLTERVVTIE
jgi:hypothetical protein